MGLKNSKMRLELRRSGSRSNSGSGHHKQPASSPQSHSDSEHSGGGGQPATNMAAPVAGCSVAQQQQQQQTFSEALASTGALALSPYQKSLIKNAWKRMNKKGIASNIGSQVFRCMLDKSPDTKRLFQHVAVIEGVFSFGLTPIQSYHHHSGYFIDVLEEAVNCMDDLSVLIPKCNEYGLKHVRYVVYGFKPEFWDYFGEAMISAAREWEGWKKHRETLRAWTILVSFIVDRMRQGYETGIKRQGYAATAAASVVGGGAGQTGSQNSSPQPNDSKVPQTSQTGSSSLSSDNGRVSNVNCENVQLRIPRHYSADNLLQTPSETPITDTLLLVRTESSDGNMTTSATDRDTPSPLY